MNQIMVIWLGQCVLHFRVDRVETDNPSLSSDHPCFLLNDTSECFIEPFIEQNNTSQKITGTEEESLFDWVRGEYHLMPLEWFQELLNWTKCSLGMMSDPTASSFPSFLNAQKMEESVNSDQMQEYAQLYFVPPRNSFSSSAHDQDIFDPHQDYIPEWVRCKHEVAASQESSYKANNHFIARPHFLESDIHVVHHALSTYFRHLEKPLVFAHNSFMKMMALEPFQQVSVHTDGMRFIQPISFQFMSHASDDPKPGDQNETKITQRATNADELSEGQQLDHNQLLVNKCRDVLREFQHWQLPIMDGTPLVQKELREIRFGFIPPGDVPSDIVFTVLAQEDHLDSIEVEVLPFDAPTQSANGDRTTAKHTSTQPNKENSELQPPRLETSILNLLSSPPVCDGFTAVLNDVLVKIRAALSLRDTGSCNQFFIEGRHGQGKTTFLKSLAYHLSRQYPCTWIDCGRTLTRHSKRERMQGLQNLISRYLQILKESTLPLCVFMDDLDQWCPATEEGRTMAFYVRKLMQEICLTGRSVVWVASVQSIKQVHHRLCEIFWQVTTLGTLSADQRETILQACVLKRGIQTRVAMAQLASQTEGYFPRDLQHLVSMALHCHTIRDRPTTVIDASDWDEALSRFRPAHLQTVELPPSELSWPDIRGLDTVKEKIIQTLLWPTRYAFLFQQSRMRPRTGLLLIGPPGCGKTLLANSISEHAHIPCFPVKGPALLQKYIGASEQAVRDVFDRALASRPSILFFDEFDALAPRRGQDQTGVTDRVVNQLLTLLDGAEELEGVFVVAATNRPDLIDPALLRPGRLDKILYCGMPNFTDRLEILQELVSQNGCYCPDINWAQIAEDTEGWTGADLHALLSNAQLEALHEQSSSIGTPSSKKSHASQEQTDESQQSSEIHVIHSNGNNSSPQKVDKDLIKRIARLQSSFSCSENHYDEDEPAIPSLQITQKCINRAFMTSRPSLSSRDRQFYEGVCEPFIASHKESSTRTQVGTRTALSY